MSPLAQPLRVAVSGAGGRVGREIVAALRADPAFACSAAVDLDEDLAAVLAAGDTCCLVDFTVPSAGLANALTAIDAGVSPVVGTTGIGAAGVERIRQGCAERGIGGCVVANFALGAALLMWLSELAARHFERCEIIEAHHPGKADAPSGTAIRTAERLLRGRGGVPFAHAMPSVTAVAGSRGGELGGAAIHSLRLDGVVADQEVVLATLGQTLSIAHRTTSRAAFVPGVLLACRTVVATGGFFGSLEEMLELPDPAAVLPAAGARAAGVGSVPEARP